MKLIIPTIFFMASTPFLASANCGSIPQPPVMLEQPELDVDQRALVSSQMDLFFESVDAFKKCIDISVAELAPADAPDSYYDSDEYQAGFNNLIQQSDSADENMNLAIERYSYLLQESN